MMSVCSFTFLFLVFTKPEWHIIPVTVTLKEMYYAKLTFCFELLTCYNIVPSAINISGVVFLLHLGSFEQFWSLWPFLLLLLKCSNLYFLDFVASQREHKLGPTVLKLIIYHWSHHGTVDLPAYR